MLFSQLGCHQEMVILCVSLCVVSSSLPMETMPVELPTAEITSSSVVETLVPISSEPIQITSFVAGTVYFTDYELNLIDGAWKLFLYS